MNCLSASVHICAKRQASESASIASWHPSVSLANSSHQRLDEAEPLIILEGRHLDLASIVLAVAHCTHNLCGIVDCGTLKVHITSLQLRLRRVQMLLTDHEELVDLSVCSTTFLHILDNIFIVLLGSGDINRQQLSDADGTASCLDLHCWQGQHTTCSWHARSSGSSDSTHWTRRIVWTFQGDWHTQHHHTVQLQGPICLIDGSDFTETIVGSLVASKPHVEDRVLVWIIAHTTLLHCVVHLLREGILSHTQVVRQVSEVQTSHLTRHVWIIWIDSSICARHPLETIPEHSLPCSSICESWSSTFWLALLVHVLLLLLSSSLLTLTTALCRLGGCTSALLLLLLLLFLITIAIAVAVTIAFLLTFLTHDGG